VQKRNRSELLKKGKTFNIAEEDAAGKSDDKR